MRALVALALFVCPAPAFGAEDWDTVHHKGTDAVKQRDFAAAADLFQKSMHLARTESENAVSENDLGIALCQAGRPAEAKTWLERALSAWSTDPSRRTLYAQTAGALALVERTLGNYSAAHAVLRKGLEQPDLEGSTRSYLLSSLGDIMREEGNFGESRRLLKEADDIAGLPWMQRLDVEIAIAELERDTGNWDASVHEWNKAAALAREKQNAFAQAACARGLGQTWLDSGNASRAEPLLKAALAMNESMPVQREGETATSLSAMGELYLAQGKYVMAEEALLRALSSDERSLGAAHPQTALVLELLADSVNRQGQAERAHRYLDRAEKIMSAQFGEHSTMAASVFVNRGALEQRAGHAENAAEQFRKALDMLGPGDGDLFGYRKEVMTRYAAALKAAHHKREAAAVTAQLASFRSSK